MKEFPPCPSLGRIDNISYNFCDAAFLVFAWRVALKISTTRFGELTVEEQDVLTFNEGMLGFEKLTKFFVVDPGDNTLIMWLQSLEDTSIAFPIIEPQIFHNDYSVKLLPSELRSLELESVSNASVYTILTIPSDVTQMSANLKAPIVINPMNGSARQIVLQDNKLSVRYERYKELKKQIISLAAKTGGQKKEAPKQRKINAPRREATL